MQNQIAACRRFFSFLCRHIHFWEFCQYIFFEKISWFTRHFLSFPCRHIQFWEFIYKKIDCYHQKCAWYGVPKFLTKSSMIFYPPPSPPVIDEWFYLIIPFYSIKTLFKKLFNNTQLIIRLYSNIFAPRQYLNLYMGPVKFIEIE